MLDTELLNMLQRRLLEPADNGTSYPSGLWTRDEVMQAITTQQNAFIRDTQVVQAWAQPLVVNTVETVNLPEDWIATLDVSVDTGTLSYPLPKSDNFAADRVIPTWQTTPDLPQVYAECEDADALKIRLAPVPNLNAILRMIYLSLAEAVDGSGIPMAVPDAACPTVLWGALGYLLSKLGRAEDLPRAAYCRLRYQEGVLAWTLLLDGVI